MTCAFAACVALYGCGGSSPENQNEANASPPPAVVKVATVRKETVPILEDYQGTIGAIDRVEIRARVQGTLDQAPFKEGEIVHKGDVIFQIQQSEYVAALKAAQAQLEQARGNLFARQAALTRANITVARNRPLAADKAIPQKELDNSVQAAEIAKGDVAAAQGQVDSASAAVDLAKINLGYTTIDSPVTGLIGFRTYDVGNVVGGPGSQVLDTVTTIDPIKITFALDESTYLALSGKANDPGVQPLREQSLRLVLANDATYQYPGRVYTVSPTVDPRTGTLTVEARFPNPDGLLRPGGFARVRVTIERRPNALLVPQTAIIKSQGVDTVYVVGDNDEVALRTVMLGPEYKQAFIVNSGLNAGDRVVTEGTQKLKPGSKVTVKSS
ncbi:MAG: efflux RND transporter periplasmic adaptor subunit [Candidatus Eremiobacteraeota bacterium]|nr:efflux RND transporter periplasmic adaptor subunit [Candidatus Eremiobacteraeota bacterium]